MTEVDYPDLGFGKPDDDVVDVHAPKVFFQPVDSVEMKVGRSINLVSDPTVVHFGGFVVNEEVTQVISIINISRDSQRISILPPATPFYKISYAKCGTLAPGMCQKITIKFLPTKYKYYYDSVRIHADAQDLLIPIHGYPVLNEVKFPHLLSFGDKPLCETATKTIKLSCSIPIPFAFSIEITRPHPYFRVEPSTGVIPASGSINITITFNPITLGTCATAIKLYVSQYNWTPIECMISARAVSGLIEQKTLPNVKNKLSQLIDFQTTELMNQYGHEKTLAVTKTPSITAINTILSKTFHASTINDLLESAIPTSTLLNSRAVSTIADGPLHGVKEVLGVPAAMQPATIHGIGSGNVFDAGATYIQAKHKATHKSPPPPPIEEDRVLEGIHMPKKLNSTNAINFILTQEKGKLKPKDLKAAIEKNKSATQVGETQEIVNTGQLTLEQILAEENLNYEEGNVFKRQMRELTFLTESENMEKYEAEKAFRISEEYLGADMLSEDDIASIKEIRHQLSNTRKKTQWRNKQAKLVTKHIPPTHEEIKSGPASFVSNALSQPDASAAYNLYMKIPARVSFDTNRNDIWSKRLNTLRSLISIVSKWILQYRVETRLAMLKHVLADNHVVDRESCKAFVAASSNGMAKLGNARRMSLAKSVGGDQADASESMSLAMLVCSLPNIALMKKQMNEEILQTMKFTPAPCNRILFPQYINDEAKVRKGMDEESVDIPFQFDDRTFFELKPRLEHIDMNYTTHAAPLMPVYYSSVLKPLRKGAPEEGYFRSPAVATATDMQSSLPKHLTELSSELDLELPTWLCGESAQLPEVSDIYHPRHEFRTYMQPPPCREMDEEFRLRPNAKPLQYVPDESLRTRLLESPGFLSAQTYLLGGYTSRIKDPLPAAGPTLTDYFSPDYDRHTSGTNCQATDHLHSLFDADSDIAPLQKAQDKNDVLTDSESDNDEEYDASVPTRNDAKKIMSYVPPKVVEEVVDPKAKKGAKNTTTTPTATAPESPLPTATSMEDGFSVLADEDRRSEQVELLRDRKFMDYSRAMQKERDEAAQSIADRLVEISEASKCPLRSIPVQLPFYSYEDSVSSLLEKQLPEISNVYNEAGTSNDSVLGSPIAKAKMATKH